MKFPPTYPQVSRAAVRLGLAGCLLSMLTVMPAYAGELSGQEIRGKQIYQKGEAVSGVPITALVARGATPISAAFLPCSGCHGEDGQGRPEGSVNPSNITWSTLTASYGHDHDYGRSHPAFDQSSLAHAITAGVDPTDNALDLAMPRYAMSASDMADLIAYIKRIETDLDPGLSEDGIKIGTLLPLEGPLESIGQSMKSVLDGYFANINKNGGIHGRHIELVVGEYSAESLQGGWNARDFLGEEPIFALVSGYLAGIEMEVAALAEEKALPLVGPYTPSPDDGDGLYRYSFYLLGGLSQQARVLARHAVTELGPDNERLAIIHPNGTVYEAAVKSVNAQGVRKNWEPVWTSSYQAPYFDAVDTAHAVDTAQTLQQEHINKVIFFGAPNDLRRLADEATRQDWNLDLMLPGVFSGKGMFDIPATFKGRVFLGYSSMPSDHTAQGVSEFEKLHTDYAIDYRHSTAQISAFVAASILVEGLKRAGRDLSRDRLVNELEGMSDFQPGLMPPISYNATRRIGALGGYVVALDLERKGFGKTSKWINLQPQERTNHEYLEIPNFNRFVFRRQRMGTSIWPCGDH